MLHQIHMSHDLTRGSRRGLPSSSGLKGVVFFGGERLAFWGIEVSKSVFFFFFKCFFGGKAVEPPIYRAFVWFFLKAELLGVHRSVRVAG